ncbi:hypothetical protein [Actinoplanes sp. M2I2]|uniref:hypothetical protein n=1 Tax=Actinoplanes sp. M2I2 TaxID=1734444 RepID=UPI0020218CD4|nr:hypothetical protein [Actinoplanes sp. M2I2]
MPGPTARALPWGPLTACLVAGLLIMMVPAAATAGLGVDNIVNLARIVMLAGALGVAFLLDDPAASTTAVLPVPRLARIAVRGLLAVPVLAGWWALTLAAAHLAVAAEVRPAVPALTLTVEAAALVCVAFALAGIRRGGAAGTVGGIVAAPLTLVLVLLLQFLPDGWSLFVGAGDPRWREAHVIWSVLAGSALLASGLLAHEPTSRRATTRPAPQPVGAGVRR